MVNISQLYKDIGLGWISLLNLILTSQQYDNFNILFSTHIVHIHKIYTLNKYICVFVVNNVNVFSRKNILCLL